MTGKINISILNEYYMYLLYIYILTVIIFLFIPFFSFDLVFSSMNMYAKKYNNLVFLFFAMEMLDMNQLSN